MKPLLIVVDEALKCGLTELRPSEASGLSRCSLGGGSQFACGWFAFQPEIVYYHQRSPTAGYHVLILSYGSMDISWQAHKLLLLRVSAAASPQSQRREGL